MKFNHRKSKHQHEKNQAQNEAKVIQNIKNYFGDHKPEQSLETRVNAVAKESNILYPEGSFDKVSKTVGRSAYRYDDRYYDEWYGSDSYAPCHTGNTELKIENLPAPIFGGGTSRWVKPSHKYFILACGVNVASPFELFNVNSKSLNDKLYQIVRLGWQDFSVPDIDTDTWLDIIQAWLESGRPLLAMCVGGHGRTGTALACIVGLLGLSQTPIALVRAKYCKEAVETKAQARYVAMITGCQDESDSINEVSQYSAGTWDRGVNTAKKWGNNSKASGESTVQCSSYSSEYTRSLQEQGYVQRPDGVWAKEYKAPIATPKAPVNAIVPVSPAVTVERPIGLVNIEDDELSFRDIENELDRGLNEEGIDLDEEPEIRKNMYLDDVMNYFMGYGDV